MPRYKDRTFDVAYAGAPPIRFRYNITCPNKRNAIRIARREVRAGRDGARAEVTLKTGGTDTVIYQCRNDDGRVTGEEL